MRFQLAVPPEENVCSDIRTQFIATMFGKALHEGGADAAQGTFGTMGQIRASGRQLWFFLS